MDRRAFLKGLGIAAAGVSAGACNDADEAVPATVRTTDVAPLAGVTRACARLASKGWADLLARHGLRLDAPDLAQELARPLASIDRSVPGFSDFSLQGTRGIEPGIPSRSLLYHALASPAVRLGAEGAPLDEYPKLADLEVVENYIYSTRNVSLASLRAQVNGMPLAAIPFAIEYRTSPDTPHAAHADLCFSRVGIARVGTAPAQYDATRRGFLPFGAAPNTFRVIPVRYAVFLAARARPGAVPFSIMDPHPGDKTRDFWVPVHKLFGGPHCLQELGSLEVTLEALHMNEKLRRLQFALRTSGETPRYTDQALDEPPFRVTTGIADFSHAAEDGSHLLVPTVHPRLLERATWRGSFVTFRVPPHETDTPRLAFGGSTIVVPATDAPELANASRRVDPGTNQEIDLSTMPGLPATVANGDYQALTFQDFTGDGVILPRVVGMPTDIGAVNAYSIVAPPSFFPHVGTRRLAEWTRTVWPAEEARLFWSHSPTPLSGARQLPNTASFPSHFAKGDASLCAVITQVDALAVPAGPRRGWPAGRLPDPAQSTLPDGASGAHHPGWDVGEADSEGTTTRMASYRLSAPFTEDMKICAAMSAYWPGLVPDVSRAYAPIPVSDDIPDSPLTVCPLLDEELGQDGAMSWDGTAAGVLARGVVGQDAWIELPAFEYLDYQASALGNRLNPGVLRHIDADEFERRTLTMLRVYKALEWQPHNSTRPQGYQLLSFRTTTRADPDVLRAEAAAGLTLETNAVLYRLQVAFRTPTKFLAPDFRRRRLGVRRITDMIVGLTAILVRKEQEAWEAKRI